MRRASHCPLCGAGHAAFYHRDARRPYLQCRRCDLVFVPPDYLPDTAAERAEYDLHRNDVNDAGYRRFLSRLATPLLARLPAGASGLDFGCGPGPALARMLRARGLSVALYDPFYAPDASVLCGRYDFICATEVVEHLHRPGAELARLWRLLAPGGWLGVMTKLVRDADAFSRWHYKNDPTHVCFFSAATWHWWTARRGAHAQFEGADVILIRRPSAATGFSAS